jgi:hypothetical protein
MGVSGVATRRSDHHHEDVRFDAYDTMAAEVNHVWRQAFRRILTEGRSDAD